jgi:type II secretory pathway pseudopilin PulG
MRKRRGATLVELVIMIAVSSVLMISITRAAMTLSEMVVDNRDRTIALNLARRQLAIMNNGAHPAVQAEAGLAADVNFPSFIPTLTVADVVTSGSLELRLVTIRIRLNSATGPVLIRLDTYRTNLVSFGDGT